MGSLRTGIIDLDRSALPVRVWTCLTCSMIEASTSVSSEPRSTAMLCDDACERGLEVR